MALLITLFLVLINIFNNVTTNSPKVMFLYGYELWFLKAVIKSHTWGEGEFVKRWQDFSLFGFSISVHCAGGGLDCHWDLDAGLHTLRLWSQSFSSSTETQSVSGLVFSHPEISQTLLRTPNCNLDGETPPSSDTLMASLDLWDRKFCIADYQFF